MDLPNEDPFKEKGPVAREHSGASSRKRMVSHCASFLLCFLFLFSSVRTVERRERNAKEE